jgi:hypothetical protein
MSGDLVRLAHFLGMRRTDVDLTELWRIPHLARAMQRERERCKAILFSPEGKANFAMATVLAFKTRTRRSEAIRMLRQAAAASSTSRRPSQADVQQSWDRAFVRATGKAI